MKINIITQARFGSTRYPGKILEKINGETILEVHLKRLKRVTNINNIIIATTFELESKNIFEISKQENCIFYQGSTNDVLNRFYNAYELYKSDYIIRVTSDCPLIDPILVNQVIKDTLDNKFSYCKTSDMYPDGTDVEIFKSEELFDANLNAKLTSEREHVTPYIQKKLNNSNKFGIYDCVEGDFSKTRFTLDEIQDFNTIKILVNELGIYDNWYSYSQFIKNNPRKFPNQYIIRNEGYIKSLKND